MISVIEAYENTLKNFSEKIGHELNTYEKLLIQMGFISGLNASVIALNSGIELAMPDLQNLVNQEKEDE